MRRVGHSIRRLRTTGLYHGKHAQEEVNERITFTTASKAKQSSLK